MRAVFAFPPLASPTYPPLGLATLAPHIVEQVPSCQLTVLDLNIEAWNLLAARRQCEALALFLRRWEPAFFDASTYRQHGEAWQALGRELQHLCGLAKHYVETGELGGELAPWLDALLARLGASDPELVGLSVVFPEQLIPALALARRLSECDPGRRLVIGGASTSAVRVEEVLRACPYVDAVVVGEGELAAVPLCRGEDWSQVPGLVYRADGAICSRPSLSPRDLAELPAADFAAIDLQAYWNPSPVLPVLFSRGCQWRRCRFCAHNHSFAHHRRRPVAAFVDELAAHVQQHGARHFYFADQFVEAGELEALAEELERRGLELAFHVMGRPTSHYTRRCLERLRAAGCRWISWGVESGSQRLLDLMAKGIEVGEARRVIRDAADVGISNLVMLIFGLPTSTMCDLDETYAFVEGVFPSIDALTASRFVLFDSTPLARHATRYGLAVLGAEEILRVGAVRVHSTRLSFALLDAAGQHAAPRAEAELQAWQRRRAWLGELPFVNELCAEHFLLHAARDE